MIQLDESSYPRNSGLALNNTVSQPLSLKSLKDTVRLRLMNLAISVYLPVCKSIYILIILSTYLAIYKSIHLSICISIHLYIIYLSSLSS